MRFGCSNCGQRLSVEREMAGHPIQCPACQATVTVPEIRPAGAREEPSPMAEAAEAPARAGRGKGLGVAVLVLLLLAVGAGVVGMRHFGHPEVSELRVYPGEIRLATGADHQSLVVQAVLPDGVTLDVTGDASFGIVNKAVLRRKGAVFYPREDGRAVVKVAYAGREVSVPVEVERSEEAQPVSFELDVMPVFMKAGCNAGACHGSSRGKDGFQLSLFGYDPDEDYFRLTRENIGRRINLAIPEESLLIQKAIGAVPHTGGELFKRESPLCETLLTWLKAGAPADGPDVAEVVKVEVLPEQSVLQGESARQQLTVRARYSDGTDRDVTSLAVFLSNNDSSVKVSDGGLATAGDRGEAFVMARYGAHTVGAHFIVIPDGLEDYRFPDVPENNYIDGLVHDKLRKLRLLPSELCSDSTFIRRVYIDIIGSVPPAEEVSRFVADGNPEKRAVLIDQLLERKEFADLWVMKWAELLQIRSGDDFSYKAALRYYEWLQERMTRNVPINEVVRELMTASGSIFKNPAASYYQVERDTLKTAENVAQVFMGMRIQCAQCHNHPFDQWTMDDYYGFSAFFAQVDRKRGEDPREYVIFDKSEGEVEHPVGRRKMEPKFLGGALPEVKDQSRREVLAGWLASPENPFFGRNIANIVWGHFMGRGIIEPVDDVRVSNPPSNPRLLDVLGTKFTESRYDFRKLVRDICNSRTYQLSTRSNEGNEMDDRNFSHASLRRMRAEVLLDCINQVTGTQEKFKGLPRGARAVEIADGNTSSYFLTTFGRAMRESVCSCEVKTEPNLSQALHLLNGSTIHEKIEQGGVVRELMKELGAPRKVIEALYLRCLARAPTDTEMEKLSRFLDAGKPPEQVLGDVFWALLNSKEFIFNH